MTVTAAVIDATVGGANANSFMTVDEITTYFGGRVPSSLLDQWTNTPQQDQIAAAIMSTTWLTALVQWTGLPTDIIQALPWPRFGMWQRNNWVQVDLHTIPPEIKNCQAEMALYLLSEDRLADFDPIKFGLRGIKAGPLSINFHERDPLTDQPSVISSKILNLLVPSWVDYILDQPQSTVNLLRA